MTAFEWVAVVGAAAWIPQIGLLAYRFAIRPKVHFLPVREAELTFNTLGPVFNVRASIVVERKDAVITQIAIVMKHEKGRTVSLEWDSYVEQFSELRTQTGERGEFARDQAATALRVTTAVPTEKFFRFRDPAFAVRQREVTAKADDLLNRVPRGGDAALEAFLLSREFTDLTSLYNNYFPWEPGRYEMTITISLLGSKRPVRGRASVALAADEVDKIRRNLSLIEKRYREIAARVPSEELTTPSHWATPSLNERAVTLSRSRKRA